MANGIGDITLPTGCENLFVVIDEIQTMELPPTLGKGTLWAWLANNGCDRFADIRRLFFGEISEDEFCGMYPDHPACYVEPEPEPEPEKLPALGYAWSSWYFGEIQAGDYRIATQTITNDGEQPLELWNIYVSNETDIVYNVLSGDGGAALGAGESHNIEIIFTPIKAGYWGGLLWLSSNDPDWTQIGFWLYGGAY